VGQLIGDQNCKDAQRSCHTSFFLSCITSATLIAILMSCKQILGNLFSSDEGVAKLVSKLIPISCIFMMGDAIQGTISGILRGLGRQKLVLFLNILGFWIFAVPIGSVMTFVMGLGVYGLWWGMVIGIYTSAAIGIWILRIRVDWQVEGTKAMKRLSTVTDLRESTDSTPVAAEEGEDDGNGNAI